MPRGHFHIGRKSKYSADFKLMIIHEAETSGITRTSRKYSLSDHTIKTWKHIYKYQGLEPTHSNNTYSKEYKTSLVGEYQKSNEKLEEFTIRHGLRGRAQLSQWIIRYNESILEDCKSGKRDSGMKSRKTTFDERLETCLCVKKRPNRRTVPQSSRILLVKILYLNCILDRT
jgi:transposase-like protein